MSVEVKLVGTDKSITAFIPLIFFVLEHTPELVFYICTHLSLIMIFRPIASVKLEFDFNTKFDLTAL